MGLLASREQMDRVSLYFDVGVTDGAYCGQAENGSAAPDIL